MNNIVVGLSGHIDHGKTSFIKSINNFDGDSREDEKQRGITIDISFSNYILDDIQISFIDVPGHQKLVKNMIKGAFSIDCLLLIVAIDDGIMPQTIEHIHIAKLLGITNVVVFISKVDLIDMNTESDRIDILASEINKILCNLEFNVLSVNAFSVHDISLINNAKQVLKKIPQVKKDSELFRYYCDRVFHKKGFGNIVTGTILGGEIKKGDKLIICDSKKEVIVKNMHNHNIEVEIAKSGQRIALNLDSSVNKGDLLSKKGFLRGFNKIDCVIYFIKDIRHLENTLFFIGSKRLNARILLLEKLDNMAFVTVTLEKEIFSVFKERFIIRNDKDTLGGGLILNPISDPINKIQKLKLLKALLNDNFLLAFDILANAHKMGFGLIQSIQRFNLSHEDSLKIAKSLKNVFVDEVNKVVYTIESTDIVKKYVLHLLDKNNSAIFSANSIHNNLKWASVAFIQIVLDDLNNKQIINKNKHNLYTSFTCNINDIYQYTKDNILYILKSSGITPKAPYNIYDDLDIDRNFGDSIFKELTHIRKVIRLSHNVFVLNEALSSLMSKLREIINIYGFIDIDLFKQHYDISRKYIICYLDYLDKFGDIKRVGNKRMFKEGVNYVK